MTTIFSDNKKFCYRLNTLSSVIVSPRSEAALYEDLGDFCSADIEDRCFSEERFSSGDPIKVIYPFYQYGEYFTYDPDQASYYLPGSSVKGALLSGSADFPSLMVDDIPLTKDDIILRSLCKLQSNGEIANAKFDIFFRRVKVEMISAKKQMEGELYLPNKELVEKLFTNANKAATAKMGQMYSYLKALKIDDEATKKKLCEITCKLTQLIDKESVLLTPCGVRLKPTAQYVCCSNISIHALHAECDLIH